MDQYEFNRTFRERTISFAVEVMKFCKEIPPAQETQIVTRQLIRSVTSVGANFRASCVARSLKERYAKYCMVAEEADETLYWLELIQKSHIRISIPQSIFDEAMEISKVVAACKKGLGKKLH